MNDALLPEERVRELLANSDLLEHLSDIVSIMDENYRFLYVSRVVGGRSKVEVLGSSALDHIPPASQEAFCAAFRRAWSSGVAQMIEASSNDEFWWENRLVPVRDERNVPLMFVTTLDITARKQAEKALAESEARLRDALEASGVGNWSWDLTSAGLWWDARLCEIWGIPRERAPRSFDEYVAMLHPDDRARVREQAERCIATGTHDDLEHRVVRPNGEVRHVLSRGTVVRGSDGRALRVRGGVFDITERKRLEERLRSAHRMEAVGQLTAGIAHNFNNLLSIILPSVELCRTTCNGDASAFLDDIEHAATRAAEMVRQLMLFARHDTSAQKTAVDFRLIVERTLSICRATFDRRIAIECETPPTLPLVVACAGEIEQVLLNVCINARDALMQGDHPAPELRLRFAYDERAVRVTVSDNGAGMTKEVQARLFEPFFTTKEVGRGTGLGLASAYGIMLDHGGSIVCDSELGRGSSFTLELPIARTPEPAEPASARSDARSHGTETLLIIDDEPAVRRVSMVILENAGYHVLDAADGEAGLSLLQRHPAKVDLIVLDRQMPRMSGEQFLVELRRRGFGLPVVMLTGYAGGEPGLEGAAAVVIKPVASGELLRAVRAALDER